MIGNLKWNIIISLIGMMMTTLFSLSTNMFLTSFIRGFYCFVVLFIVSFFVRWFLGVVMGLNQMDLKDDSSIDNEEQFKGSHVDISTPVEDGFKDDNLQYDNESSSLNADFSPLSPPKLASKDKMDAEELVKAIRHLSED